MIELDYVDVVIRIFEYMCRWLIFIGHYCFGDEHFVSNRNRSLDKWFSKLIDNYFIAFESSMFAFSITLFIHFSHEILLNFRAL